MHPLVSVTEPICICMENILYFYTKDETLFPRIHTAGCEFLQDAVTIRQF